MSNKTILEIKSLTVSCGEKRIIDDVSFSLSQGEVLSIVGESGSGKTMTALSVLDLLPGDFVKESGEIFFRGKDVFLMGPESKRDMRGREISMVFQEPFTSLNPVLCIKDQLSEALITHGKTCDDKVLSGALKRVSLSEDIWSAYPHELSGGMRQRVMLAMGLICDPSIIILDEPTTALDVSIQKEILDLIKDIQRVSDLAIIFITHDLSIVNNIADRVCVMRKGSIVERGTKEEILKHPQDEYTKFLLECIPRLGDERDRLPEAARRP